MTSKTKNEVRVEKSSGWRFRRAKSITLSVAMDEKDIMEIVKSIPKRCNTDMVKYKVFVSVEAGRKTFILTQQTKNLDKREGIHAALYSDENFIETRVVIRLGKDPEIPSDSIDDHGYLVGALICAILLMIAVAIETVSPLARFILCGIPFILICMEMLFFFIRERIKPPPDLVDFLKEQLEQ